MPEAEGLVHIGIRSNRLKWLTSHELRIKAGRRQWHSEEASEKLTRAREGVAPNGQGDPTSTGGSRLSVSAEAGLTMIVPPCRTHEGGDTYVFSSLFKFLPRGSCSVGLASQQSYTARLQGLASVQSSTGVRRLRPARSQPSLLQCGGAQRG